MKAERLCINGLEHQIYHWGNPGLPMLFFVHGWMDTGASFAFACEFLAKDFHCIALDLRGFGRSEHTGNPLGYFFVEYVADLHRLFAHFSPQAPVRLVGHSMGGNIVSLYAGTFPERVSHMINAEGFGIQDMLPAKGPERVRAWIEASAADRFKVYATLDEVADRLRVANPDLPLDRARWIAPYMTRPVVGGFAFSADPKHKWPNPYLYQLQGVYPFWESIRAHCLLVGGETSKIGVLLHVPDVQAEIEMRLSHFPKNSQRRVLRDCGHMLHHENPRAFAQAVRDFIAS